MICLEMYTMALYKRTEPAKVPVWRDREQVNLDEHFNKFKFEKRCELTCPERLSSILYVP